MSRTSRPGFPRWGALGAALFAVAVLVAPIAGAATVVPQGPSQTLVLPVSAFNITDHNLTYATNMLVLPSPLNSSYSLTVSNDLVAASASDPSLEEMQLSFGPGPAGPEEDNITPIFILQEAATGFLRLEYVPFPMSNTYAFIVFQGYVATAGPSAFAGHQVTFQFTQSAPPIAPYPVSVPYGYSTGNLTLLWDGQPLVTQYPIAWSTLTAFYGYGLTTGTFASGSVTLMAQPYSPTAGPAGTVIVNGSIGAVPTWVVAGLAAAVVGAAVGAALARGRPPSSVAP
jgi:hypothetical protein